MDQTNIPIKTTGDSLTAAEFNTINSRINELISETEDILEELSTLSSTLSNHTHADLYEPLKGTDDNYVTDSEKTKLSNLSGTNTGDQSADDFDIKDLADSTNLKTTWSTPQTADEFDIKDLDDTTGLRNTWSSKQSALTATQLEFLASLASNSTTITLDADKVFIFNTPIYTPEVTTSITTLDEIGSGTSVLIDLNTSDKFRFINADTNLLINNITNPRNGALFIITIVASDDISITFSAEWGTYIDQPIILPSGSTLMISGYITGGSIITNYLTQIVETSEIPILDSFTLGTGSSTTTKSVSVNVSTSGGLYTDYKIAEGATSAILDTVEWVSGEIPTTFTLSTVNEVKTVWLNVKNSAGNATAISDSITLAIPIPVISSVILGDGSGTANTFDVDLTITATNTPTHYKAKHVATGTTAPDLSLESWIVLGESPTYTLPDEGTYDVYVVTKNEGNELSNVVYDTIEIAIVGESPIVSISAISNICQGSTISPSAIANNYTSLLWTTSGDGTFSSTTILAPTYTPGSSDISSGSVTLTLTATGDGSASDSEIATIIKTPTVSVGADQTITEGDTVTIDATATNYASLLWTTSGDGTFSTSTAADTIYTPGANDVTAGTATLTLTAGANTPCISSVTDSLVVTIEAAAADPITININHGSATLPSGWNQIIQMRSTESEYLISNAVDENGVSTGIGFTKSLAVLNKLDPGNSQTSTTYSVTTGGPNQIIDTVPANLNVVYMHITRNTDYGDILVSGLTPSKQYKVRTLNSSSTSGAAINMAVVPDVDAISQQSDMVKFATNLATYQNTTPVESAAFYPKADGTCHIVAWRAASGLNAPWNWTKLIEV